MITKEVFKTYYGKKKNYLPGDIVVWRGQTPCIGRITRGLIMPKDWYKKLDPISLDIHTCFYIDKKHSSLHYSNLRPATKHEIFLLGSEIKLLFNPNIFNYGE